MAAPLVVPKADAPREIARLRAAGVRITRAPEDRYRSAWGFTARRETQHHTEPVVLIWTDETP